MTSPSTILSVGTDPVLMSSRTLILRAAGYHVAEAYSVDKAIDLSKEAAVDAVLICHTVPAKDQQLLISAVREKRKQMPILCLRSHLHASVQRTCIAIDSDPEALLNELRKAVLSAQSGSIT